jgi:RNA polymerase-binding transcription factor DksA
MLRRGADRAAGFFCKSRGGANMTKTEMNQYKKRLLTMGRRIQGDFRSVAGEALRSTGGEPSGNLSNAPFHLADLSNDTMEHEVAVGLLENQSQLLEQISTALDRVEGGTYGRCMECNREIPAERLDVVPYTPYCVQCAGRIQAGG